MLEILSIARKMQHNPASQAAFVKGTTSLGSKHEIFKNVSCPSGHLGPAVELEWLDKMGLCLD